MALTIRRAQRNVLRQQVITELTGIGDIYLAVAADQWATALKLRERHEDLMRLLDDLGWRPDDPAEEFALTTEPARLLRCLARLHERAGETIEQYVGADAEERAAAWDASFVMSACGDLLVKLLAAAHLQGAPGCHDGSLHRNYVGAIERGEINPTLRILFKLATGLTLPLSSRARSPYTLDGPSVSAPGEN